MEHEGTCVKFFCVVCGLQGTLIRDPEKTVICPRCESKVMMTPLPVREKASLQLTC